MERGWKANVEISPSCPRCGSLNTKFCYYNNYSLTQPRYFCKGCRRYWTKGGSLRNIPVGGGCRKSRRGKSLRLSSNTGNVVHSKSLSYGTVHPSNKGVSSFESPSSSAAPDGSHIDLALVFANFLNLHQQNSKSSSGDLEMPSVLPAANASEFDPSPDQFTRISNRNFELSDQLGTVENDHLGCSFSITDHLSMEAPLSVNDHNLMYYCGLESANKRQDTSDHQQCTSHRHDTIGDFSLPPLPGELELGTDHHHHQEIVLWSNNTHHHDMIEGQDHHGTGLQVTQEEPELGHETDDQDPNVLFGNWSPFDLSSTDDTFSKDLTK